MGWMTRVQLLAGAGIFLIVTKSRLILGPTPSPIIWVLGALSLGVKLLGREAGSPNPSSAKVNNMCHYASTSPYISMA